MFKQKVKGGNMVVGEIISINEESPTKTGKVKLICEENGEMFAIVFLDKIKNTKVGDWIKGIYTNREHINKSTILRDEELCENPCKKNKQEKLPKPEPERTKKEESTREKQPKKKGDKRPLTILLEIKNLNITIQK